MLSPCTVATMCSPLIQPFPHTRARAPSRQFEIAECRCQLFFPILCGLTRAVQAVLQATARTCVRRLDKYSSSCWSVEVRSSHRQPLGDLRQHYFQRLQRRRRRVQLWPRVCLVFLLDPPRAHVGLPFLTLVSFRPSCLAGFLPRLTWARLSLGTLVYILWRRMYSTSPRLTLAHSSGSGHPPLLSSQCHPSHTLSSSCSSLCMSFSISSCT